MNTKEKELVDIIDKLENFEEATDALTDLKYLNPERAGEAAFQILSKQRGDSHFQARAFEILYSVDQKLSIDFLNENLETVNLDILGAILECITEDAPLVEDNKDLRKVLATLSAKVQRLSAVECKKLGDTLDWFKSTFKNQF